MSGLTKQTVRISQLKAIRKQVGRALRSIRLLNAELGMPEDLDTAATIVGNVENYLLTAQTRLEEKYLADLKVKQFLASREK